MPKGRVAPKKNKKFVKMQEDFRKYLQDPGEKGEGSITLCFHGLQDTSIEWSSTSS